MTLAKLLCSARLVLVSGGAGGGLGVWSEGAGWCFCSGGGDVRSERVKAAIFSAKAAALAAVSGHGSGLLIHRNLLLTTHGNLPSAAAAEDAEALLGHGRLATRLEPHR